MYQYNQKLLDLIILCQNSNIIQINDMQFGFKCQFSMVLSGVIEHYRRSATDTLSMMLEVSKAFCRVH